MFKTKRIGHVGLTVPDVERTAAFYERIVGLEISDRADGAVFLRCNADHHCLGLYPGESRGLHHLGVEVHNVAALRSAEQALARHDVLPERRSYVEPGHGATLHFRDPDGNPIELYVDMQTLEQPLQPREVRPLKYGHTTFLTADLTRSLAFYTEVLGFRISDTSGDAVAWLRCNHEHHGVALLNSGQAKVNHYAYDLADWNEIKPDDSAIDCALHPHACCATDCRARVAATW